MMPAPFLEPCFNLCIAHLQFKFKVSFLLEARHRIPTLERLIEIEAEVVEPVRSEISFDELHILAPHIPASDIVTSRNYLVPVLTVGKSFIIGNTNEKSGIFPNEKLPVIIFDDFTTAIKFTA